MPLMRRLLKGRLLHQAGRLHGEAFCEKKGGMVFGGSNMAKIMWLTNSFLFNGLIMALERLVITKLNHFIITSGSASGSGSGSSSSSRSSSN